MSPIVARATLRAARAQQSRQFSVMRTMRNVGRSFEPHPFQRLPMTANPQPGNWAKYIKRSGGQAMIYFPFFGAVLGWPLLASAGLDGHI